MTNTTRPAPQARPDLGAAARTGALLAYGVGAVLHGAHAGYAVDGTWLTHWLRDSTLAFPLAVLVALVGARVANRLTGWGGLGRQSPLSAALRMLLPVVLYAVAVVPAGAVHARLFDGGGAHAHAFWRTAALDSALALLSGLSLLLVSSAVAAGVARRRAHAPRVLARRRLVLVGLSATAVVAGALPSLAAPTVPATPETQQAVASCNASTANRTYDVAAVNVHVPYNRWGDADPHGMVYVLQTDKQAMLNWDKPLDPDNASSNRRVRPRPLVLRANEGDCVQVRLTNELTGGGEGLPLAPRASISVRGVPFDVQTSGGSNAGYNDDTTVAQGQSIVQYWRAPQEGSYLFHDTATPAGSEADGGSVAHGLFGTLNVEPAGSVWRDAVNGGPLYSPDNSRSGDLYLDAIIDPPTGRTFRESTQLAQDEMPVTSGFGFNYGSEPQSNREAEPCPDCIGEETSLSSWTAGDPAMVKLASGLGPWKPGTTEGEENCGLGTAGFDTDSCFTSNVTHAYARDPIKFRFGMAGGRETHVFHMHANTWLADPDDVGAAGPTPSQPGPDAMPESSTIDSQTFGPMEMFTADLLFGAGGKAGTVGDSIFHCHLYPHFAAGFWGLMRVHDVLERGRGAPAGLGTTPDGVNVAAVEPLDDKPSPPLPTPDNPGYPRFIPGEFGNRAPQPPLGIRASDGSEATRYVAGKPLEGSTDPARIAALALERAAMTRLSGGRSKPGAPFTDPCPNGSREVTFKVSAIQTNVVHNERGDEDTQARMLVLDSDVDDVLAGRKQPEPLFTRVNAGDCVVWELTNRLPNWFGNDAFQQLTQTNMIGEHVHLVKFDVLASDGSSNGWNYQQAAFSAEQAAFNENIAANPETCTADVCRIPKPATYDPRTESPSIASGIAPGQTIVARWFADYELRTAFTHDHHFAAIAQNRGQYGALVVEPAGMDFRDPRTGAFMQPVNTSGRGLPVCETACEGRAAGAVVDVIGPGPDDDFRDFGLAVADFVSLTRRGGNPAVAADVLNPPPNGPEHFPDEDPGVMAINYRNAPLELRTRKNGQPVDPAYAFSSTVWGDPMTPVLQTYAGDNVRIRLIQGSQEEEHQVLVHGQKWRKDPNDPGSPMIDGAVLGVSEAFNFEVPRFNCAAGEDCRGDFLYSGSSVDEMAFGVWGIMRVNGGRVPGLLPLPDNVPLAAGTVPARDPAALSAPPATSPGTPCAPGAPVRTFDVVAMEAKLTYNEAGDNDPYGLVYALASEEAAIRGGKNPEPLVLRVTEGDCIEVNLTNKLTTAFQNHTGPADGDALVPPENTQPRVPGLRVSMHPGMLKYDVRGSDGAAVGFNPDSTVAPGSSITYRWFADEVTPAEIGAAPLSGFGDVIGQRHHGLAAALVVEPKGAKWHDPVTGRPGASGSNADIRVPGRADYRESVVFIQDGLNLRTADGQLIGDHEGPAEPGEPVEKLDTEDRGERAYGYRSEPFRHRLGFEPTDRLNPDGAAMAGVYDSRAHGDPATSMMRAYSGDPLRVRIMGTGTKPRQHTFSLDGHGFKPQPDDPEGRATGTLSGITVGSAVNADMGVTGVAGDYLYGSMNRGYHRSAGLWGLLRTYTPPSGAQELLPTAVPEVDDPRAGGHPLLPLELDTIEVDVFGDTDADGVRDPDEGPVDGATVSASSRGTLVSKATTGADGRAFVSVRAGSYDVSAEAEGLRSRTSQRATTNGDNSWTSVTVPLAVPPVIATESVSGLVPPGGTLASSGQSADPQNPITTAVTSPQGGEIRVVERALTPGTPAPPGYSLLGVEADVSAPAATTGDPLRLVFRLDGSLLPEGEHGRAISVQRDGAVVGDCVGADVAAPDPCLVSTSVDGDDTTLTVLTSQASIWTFATPTPASIAAACTGITGESFSDVDGGNVHAAAIRCLSGLGITSGVGGGRYDPVGSVSRAQMASFVHRLLTQAGYSLPQGDPGRFSDDSGVHEAAISSLAEAGVINGTSATTYGPSSPVSRAQMAALLDRGYRLLGGVREATGNDYFGDDKDSIHAQSINNLAALGVTTGLTATEYGPNANVRRDQMASFLTRLSSRLVAEGTSARR